jgi:hypothetical protein
MQRLSSALICLSLQEQASKHLKLLWSKAMVVSVEEKIPPRSHLG